MFLEENITPVTKKSQSSGGVSGGGGETRGGDESDEELEDLTEEWFHTYNTYSKYHNEFISHDNHRIVVESNKEETITCRHIHQLILKLQICRSKLETNFSYLFEVSSSSEEEEEE